MRDNLHLLNELRSEGEDITHLRHVQLLPSQFTILSLQPVADCKPTSRKTSGRGAGDENEGERGG